MTRLCFLFAALAALASCGPASDDGPIEVAIVGEPDSLLQQGVRLSPAAQHLRAATVEGLVALDQTGQIVPAIAERWIVTDDGLSYIFRLRDSNWPDGEEISAEDVHTLLRDTIRRLDGTSLGLDLQKVTDVRAMTGRVIELRLSSPMPEFLRLLAQPELGLARNGSGSGPMSFTRQDEQQTFVRLTALPPESRGLPAREGWRENTRNLTVRAATIEQGVAGFSRGEIDLLLNGRISSFPLAQLGPLSRGTVQVDPALGLFGLVFRHETGLLADPLRREALSMAIDRTALIAPFGLGGWQPTSWIVPPSQFRSATIAPDRWEGTGNEELRAIAAQRIAQWQPDDDDEAVVRVALPPGPGSELLFDQIASDWRAIGVSAIRVEPDEPADLELRDRLARYSSPRWFLNQFNCELEIGLCAPDADDLVAQSLSVIDPVVKEQFMVEAHQILVEEEVFIPLGAPVRWALVRGALDAYAANQWGLHPLHPLSGTTI